MMAYAFLQSRRLAQAGRKKKSRWAAASTQPPGSSPSHSWPPIPLATEPLSSMRMLVVASQNYISAKVVLGFVRLEPCGQRNGNGVARL